MKRTSLARKTSLRRVSKKRAAELAAYRKELDEWLATHRACEGCGIIERLECHHSRGRIGRLLRDKRFWIALCADCHAHVHARPEWARRVGLLAPASEFNVAPK